MTDAQMPDLLAYFLRALRTSFPGRRRQDQNKFVATVATRDVAPANMLSEKFSEVTQHRIAGVMPKAVVEPLEVIDIEHDDRQLRGVALRATHFLRQGFFHVTPVVESRQRIPNRHAGQGLPELKVADAEPDGVPETPG